MNLSTALRRDLSVRAQYYAQKKQLPFCLSYGDQACVCFIPYGRKLHGNFLERSYAAIQANLDWRKRLTKVHTLAQRSLPRAEGGRWMELDSCISSDALLMNIFCYPGVFADGRLAARLGVSPDPSLCFGYKARVPLANGKFDRTEVDLRIGDLLIEAKLTEGDFQRAAKKLVVNYRDLEVVFNVDDLPQAIDRFLSYQLLRNVLAAFALDCSFCVIADARRPDLSKAWYEVMKCVRSVELRTRLRIATWQEIAGVLPSKARMFLGESMGSFRGRMWLLSLNPPISRNAARSARASPISR